MQNNKDSQFNDNGCRNDAIIHANIMNNPAQPQLTPTGKISHAKTRVYTQRYRKAWEQMPDFKGWLTSVPHQPTRAFCTYCRKNLHAHRLSLLKHTCTMKHQRGALMHQRESVNNKVISSSTNVEEKIIPDIDSNDLCENEIDDTEEDEDFKLEDEEVDDDEDIEYVVERLDDEEDIDDVQCKDVVDNEYVDDEDEENLTVSKKIKTDHDENTNRPDTLAEAMAHVHGEYLDDNGESVNVELEMVVESVDNEAQEMRIVSVRTDREDDEDNQMTLETYENDDNSNDYNPSRNHEDSKDIERDNQPIASSCKSSLGGESSDGISDNDENDVVNKTPLVMPVKRDYLTRPSTARGVSVLPVTRGVSNSSNGSSATVSNLKKTITFTSGGKTVTLDASAITSYPVGGSRFLQLNTKGQGNTIVVGGGGAAAAAATTASKINQGNNNEGQIKIARQQIVTNTGTTTYSVAGTSQSTPRKHIILKSVKPLVAKKPCISTHVLDTSKGLPVGGLQISLYKLMEGRWTFVSESNTTADGRCADLVDTTKYSFTAGRYKLHFDVDKYFTLRRIETMYPFIEIIFDVKNPTEHYHVPVLISPFGYTTYRGS